jgi:enterochelin esterase family protein
MSPGIDMKLTFAIAFTVLLSVASQLCGQTAPPRKNTYHSSGTAAAAPRFVSPEVHADRTVTFRIRAPKASEVAVAFQGMKPMAKDADGTWSLTVGPLEPEIYEYSFMVDGARVLDTANTQLKTGRALSGNLLEIPGTPPRFDEVQEVPHGSIQVRTYTSTPLKRRRQLYVYLPPQYDAETARRFPVLYLRHGSGDDESTWSLQGRAGIILENLIAQGKAVPMLIVMTNGDTDNTWAGGSSPEALDLLGKELLGDVIPLIENNYRVTANRANRAITGLSMGGGQAFTIGLKHLEMFAWVGEFSSGLLSDTDFNLSKHLPGMLEDPARANQQLKLLFLSCGTEDPRIPGHLDLMDNLKAKQIRYVWYPTAGAHEWKVWRHSLAEFLPKLFR